MLAVLPIVLLCALSVIALRHAPDWRRALVIATLGVSLWTVIGTEGLSLVRGLTPTGVAAWWLTGLVVAGLMLVRGWRRGIRLPTLPAARPERAMAAAAGVLIVLTGALALFTPPTTHDCLSYHLPRQLFWIQQSAVAHFPASDPRQIELAPFTEYVGVHLMLLSGGDGPINMVQWVPYALTAVIGCAVAAELGAGSRAQWLSALLLLGLPMAAIQSMNPKNDVTCAMFALVVLYAAVRIMRRPDGGWLDRLTLACALGLMVLTKGTGFIIAAPIGAVVAWVMLKELKWRGLAAGAVMGVVALSINAGHWARNFEAFGSPIARSAAQGGFRLSNDLHSPAAIVSNIVRNVALHTGTPWDSVNKVQVRAVAALHETIGLAVDDPRTTAVSKPAFTVANRWNLDSGASASLHLLLAAGLVAWTALGWRRVQRMERMTTVVAVGATLLFCVLLKWQPWHARLHVPFFHLFAVPTAMWMSRWRWAGLRRAVTAVVAGLAVATVLMNETKPLLGKKSVLKLSAEETRYFYAPQLRLPAIAAAERLAALRPATVGLAFPPHSCEYLFMREVLRKVSPRPRFVNMLWTPHPRPASDEPPPDAVLMMTWDTPTSQVHVPSGTRYDTLSAHGMFYVQVPTVRAGAVLAAGDRPSFFGWDSEEGLERLEGPYPQWDLPLVRWAKSPRTLLRFSTLDSEMVLLMECRRNDRPDQAMTIRLNGEVVSTHEFGPQWVWVPFRIPLMTRAGQNELVFEYRNVNEPGEPRSVLFRRLQLLPASWAEPPTGSAPVPAP